MPLQYNLPYPISERVREMLPDRPACLYSNVWPYSLFYLELEIHRVECLASIKENPNMGEYEKLVAGAFINLER